MAQFACKSFTACAVVSTRHRQRHWTDVQTEIPYQYRAPRVLTRDQNATNCSGGPASAENPISCSRRFLPRIRPIYEPFRFSCSVLRVSLLHLLPRDAMRKRGLCCRPVSVRLSVCHVVDCIQMDISKLLSRPSSPIILVF